jgi:beta-galactosidase
MMALKPGLEALDYFGRGPWENYPDRKSAAMVGRWQNTVSDEYVPYIMPQEHGLHCDVRWLALSGPAGRALRVDGDKLMFSASHFTPADLFAARHTVDLSPRPEIVLCLDAAHRGLGTASCGPDTLEKYRIEEPEYRLDYVLRLV